MDSTLLAVINIIGTIAFAISGVMVAVHKRMDLFGVNILGLTTAVGGGAIRDILIGHFPPEMFCDSSFVFIALITSNICFLVLYSQHRKSNIQSHRAFVRIYELVLFLSDSLGLAAFTVTGTVIGLEITDSTLFLQVFLGCITGVGGGILRDILAQETPAILKKHIYAVASLIGALAIGILWNSLPQEMVLLIGFILVVLIRCLASYYKWNLPRITE